MITVSLSIPLHAEIARRAAAWTDMIAQAVTVERHRVTGRAAADMITWLHIANQLGWSQNRTLPDIDIRGGLSLALDAVDLRTLPETAEEWDRCVKSAAATLARLRTRADDLPDGAERLRGMAAIVRALDRAHAHWRARNPQPEIPQQEAA